MEVRSNSDVEAKIESLKGEILYTFEKLFLILEKRRHHLLSRLSTIKTAHNYNLELDKEMMKLRVERENAVEVLNRNLLEESLDSITASYESKIESKMRMKKPVENINFVTFRCLFGQIQKAVEETDLIESIPEYMGRENPIIKSCPLGTANGEFQNPRGIAFDRKTFEVYIADVSNNRIQVMTTNGEFIRSFGKTHLSEVHTICLSNDAVFVTDRQKYLMKFCRLGRFLKKTGRRGAEKPGNFMAIAGLGYDEGLIYVCDFSLQNIQIFNSELEYLRTFSSVNIKNPIDIKINSSTIYVLSRDQNVIYCFSKDCKPMKTIKLTGESESKSNAFFFAIDCKGNFIISEHTKSEIRIYAPNGQLKHKLGVGHLRLLTGVALDSTDTIICVNNGRNGDCFQKY